VQPFNEHSLNEKLVYILSVDLNGSIDMVRNKNFEALHQSGGVKAVVVVLETNIKGIISGNGATLI